MASQPERIASLETSLGHLKIGLLVLVPVLLTWGAYITVNVISMKQAITDGGNTKLVAELKVPKSPLQLHANLATVTAQIETARANGVQPNPQKVRALTGALSQVVQNDPKLVDAWRAVATLASYSTSEIIEKSALLPDCDVSQKFHLIIPGEIPEIPIPEAMNGYVFRNCKLHMDHLPSGKLLQSTLAKQFDEYPPGTPIVVRIDAFIINCEIVLTDSGIAESDILVFNAANCRFEYQVEDLPSPSAQHFLLASVETPIVGRFSLHLSTANGG